MLQDIHYRYLDQLKTGESFQDRKDALSNLEFLEKEGKTDEEDLERLLFEEDPAIQNYAIGALGRLHSKRCIPSLKRLFEQSSSPLVLVSILETFLKYGTTDFLDATIRKLQFLKEKGETKKKQKEDYLFILDQILIASLKYIQVAGNQSVEKVVEPFLRYGESNVRWHTLKLYRDLGIPLDRKELRRIQKTDDSLLNRELASMMLEGCEQTEEKVLPSRDLN